jgi:glyoxylase-like metal-dependent hydrolase (beta-lactamase superfamily II)
MYFSDWPNTIPRIGNTQLAKAESYSPWFEVYKLDDLTYALLEPNHCEEVISYLILGREKAVLFDSGMGIGNIKTEIECITKLPIIVINSHSHYDHIGGNYLFSEIWCFRNDFESARIKNGYSKDECKEYLNPGNFRNIPTNIDISEFYVHGSKITKFIDDQENINLGERNLIVYSTPGETPGGICIFDTRFKYLFTGDLIYPGTLWFHLGESNLNSVLHSLRILENIYDDISTISPAHNEAQYSKKLIIDVKNAIVLINKGNVEGTVESDDIVRYRFSDFSIALPKKR